MTFIKSSLHRQQQQQQQLLLTITTTKEGDEEKDQFMTFGSHCLLRKYFSDDFLMSVAT